MPDESLVPGSGGAAEELSRRSFVKAGVAAAGTFYAAVIGYPIYRYLATPVKRAEAAGQITEVSLSAADLPGPRGVYMFKFGTRPTMLIQHEDGSLICLDAVCTHLGCTVKYQPDKNRIHCACHGGVYDPATGRNVSGPPPKPLRRYNVEVVGNEIIVSRV